MDDNYFIAAFCMMLVFYNVALYYKCQADDLIKENEDLRVQCVKLQKMIILQRND